jgi:hypothetical protein
MLPQSLNLKICTLPAIEGYKWISLQISLYSAQDAMLLSFSAFFRRCIYGSIRPSDLPIGPHPSQRIFGDSIFTPLSSITPMARCWRSNTIEFMFAKAREHAEQRTLRTAIARIGASKGVDGIRTDKVVDMLMSGTACKVTYNVVSLTHICTISEAPSAARNIAPETTVTYAACTRKS